jgi:hypothetical protein
MRYANDAADLAGAKILGDLASEQYAAWMEVRKLAVRAHQICNLMRIAYPHIGELDDNGALHEAIHDLMRVDWPTGKLP